MSRLFPRPVGPTMFKPRFASFLVVGTLMVLVSAVRASAQTPEPPTRQVTLLGVIATPGGAEKIDPKLEKFEAQLRKLMPKHNFRLVDVQSKRLGAGQSVTCDLESGFTASATLTKPVDDNGKVQIRCLILKNKVEKLDSRVTTPANQLFFCEKALPNGSKLLVGIGAR